MRIVYLLFMGFGLIATALISCNSTKKATPSSAPVSTTNATTFKAVVQEVLPINSEAGFPCNTYPCKAKMRVVKVMQKGKFYPESLTDKSIIVHFPFTTLNTTSVLPELNQSFPGFAVNDSLVVELQQNTFNADSLYTAVNYKLL